MTKREEIARAIFYKHRPGRSWAGLHPYEQKPWFDAADAALATMRDPTPEMLDAMHEWVRDPHAFLRRGFDAAIDVACNETEASG